MYKTHARSKHARNSDIDLQDDLIKIKAMLAETSRDIKDKAGEVVMQSFENAKEKTAAAKENITDYIAEKPIKSLGVALFTGMIVGLLLRKKKR